MKTNTITEDERKRKEGAHSHGLDHRRIGSHQLGNALSADIIGWGAAVIGIALTASAVLWVLRILRS